VEVINDCTLRLSTLQNYCKLMISRILVFFLWFSSIQCITKYVYWFTNYTTQVVSYLHTPNFNDHIQLKLHGNMKLIVQYLILKLFS